MKLLQIWNHYKFKNIIFIAKGLAKPLQAQGIRAQAAQPAVSEEDSLSPRERDILDMLAQGFMYKEIADKLGTSYATVRTHIERIYGKLHVNSRSQGVAKSINGRNHDSVQLLGVSRPRLYSEVPGV